MFAARLFLVFIIRLTLFLPASAAFALELGDMVVDSRLGEIFYARVNVSGDIEASPTVALAAPAVFRENRISWLPLHERLIVAQDLRSSPPYVFIRSIDFVDTQDFGLVLVMRQNGEVEYTTYRATLKPRISLSGRVRSQEILSTPQLLNILVAYLSADGKVSPAAVFTELVSVNEAATAEEGQKGVILRMENEPDPKFVNALLAIMTPKDRQRFSSLSAGEGTTRQAIMKLLFMPPSGLLRQLLDEGMLLNVSNEQQDMLASLRQAEENNFALQNALLALQSELEVLRKDKSAALVQDQTFDVKNPGEQGFSFVALFDYSLLLLTRDVWIWLMAISFIMWLLLSAQWLRARHQASARAKRKAPNLW